MSDVPLRPAQWVSVSESPGFATGWLCRAFAVTGTSHPACLTGKVNAFRNGPTRIGAGCGIETEFPAAGTRRQLALP